jgi:cobalt-zinc-cadmium efflux system membrane fusion protein
VTTVEKGDWESGAREHPATIEVRGGLPQPLTHHHHRRLISVRTLIVGVALGVALVWGYGRFIDQPDKAATGAQEKVPKLIRQGYRIAIPAGSPLRDYLVIDSVHEEVLERRLESPAVVEPDPARLVKVLPPLNGRVTQLHVQLGDHVTPGQPLVTLDSSDLAAAFADDRRARTTLQLAERNERRMTLLLQAQAVSQRDLEQARGDLAFAQTEHLRTQTRLKQLGVAPDGANTREITIRSPIDGRVIELAAARGSQWNDATVALMSIADLNTVYVTANLPEKDTHLVSVGEKAEAEFSAYPGVTYYGRVQSVSDVLDPDTRRIKARIAFDNPGTRLKPGMFANVTFVSVAETVPVVPTAALLMLRDRTQVYVEVEPWVFVAREVEPAYQRGDVTAVRRGLEPGARVIARGGVLLND